MFNSILVELEILSSSITSVQIKEYENAVEQYKEDMDFFERMGIGTEPKAPDHPEEDVQYKKVHYNFSNKVIKSWLASFDPQRKVDIIVVDVYDADTNTLEQLNIKMLSKQWKKFLESNGAIHTKP